MTVGKASSPADTDTAIAARLVALAADGFPNDSLWDKAPAIRFSHDWQGKNADKGRETEVRLLWNPEGLFIKFVARYRCITVFADADPNGRRDHLWDHDVAEVFLQPNGSAPHCYKEIEVSPNGQWVDLNIAPGEKQDLQSGLRRRVVIDEKRKIWQAELGLPMQSLTQEFDSARAWRVNFFRVEGPSEPRCYSAWRPTGTAVPNFHVPECFGKLLFEN